MRQTNRKRRTNKGKTKRRKTRRTRLNQRGGDIVKEFFELCSNNNLEGAQRFLAEHPNIREILRNDDWDRLFCNESYRGHLDIMKWLLEVNPEINISADNEEPFRRACEYGYLNMAQWLFEIAKERGREIDVHIHSGAAFRNACYRKHLDVVEWLTTIKPEYDIEYNNENGTWRCKYLTDPRDINRKRRKYVSWLASGRAGDNMVFRMPTDVARITASYL